MNRAKNYGELLQERDQLNALNVELIAACEAMVLTMAPNIIGTPEQEEHLKRAYRMALAAVRKAPVPRVRIAD